MPDSPDIDDRLAAELEAALGDMSLDDMMDLMDRPSGRGKSGIDHGSGPQMKTGMIVRLYKDDVFVEFGPKSQGVCPRSDFENPPTVGERMPFVVDRFDPKDGLLILSRQGAVQKAAWETLHVGQVIEAMCTATNKGGLDMEVAKHRAFMPAGQVDIRHIDDLEQFVDQKMTCEVMELDRSRNRIVLSRRKVLEVERASQRDKVLEEIAVGDERTATIRSIQPYGAFADIGGLDGLIHVSDICHERINNPSERLKEGDEVKVKVLKIDRSGDRPRIGLGMKQCLADPYASQAAQIKEGATVTGKVTRIMPFGAFVELSPGVEGLIHISQLSNDRVQKVSSVLKPNEVVTVKVIDVDAQRRRISLSMRALQSEDDNQPVRSDDPAMAKLRAKFGGELKGGIG